MPSVEMIDLQSGKNGKELTSTCNNLSLAVSNDTRRLLTGDSEGGLHLIDIESGELLTGFTAAPWTQRISVPEAPYEARPFDIYTVTRK